VRECIAVLLHFRSVDLTLRCVASLDAQGVDAVVIVDNSEDAGFSLSALRAGLPAGRIHVRYLEPGTNLGFARGVNTAVAAIVSERRDVDLLLINSDATLAPGTVDHLRRAVAGEAAVIAAPSIDGPTGLVPARTYYRHLSGAITPAGPGWLGHGLLGGACLMVHRSLVKAPLFDESFFFYGDDIELGYRMGKHGVILADVPEGIVIHQGSGSSGNGSLFYEYHMSRAHLLLVGKLGYSPPTRIALLGARMVSLGLRAAVRSFRYRSVRPWKGLVMAFFDVSRGRHRTLTPPCDPPAGS
jgi:GT2 family glycosyltransferase